MTNLLHRHFLFSPKSKWGCLEEIYVLNVEHNCFQSIVLPTLMHATWEAIQHATSPAQSRKTCRPSCEPGAHYRTFSGRFVPRADLFPGKKQRTNSAHFRGVAAAERVVTGMLRRNLAICDVTEPCWIYSIASAFPSIGCSPSLSQSPPLLQFILTFVLERYPVPNNLKILYFPLFGLFTL